MRIRGLLIAGWLCFLAALVLLTRPASGCPACNVNNHLGMAVRHCQFIGIGQVVNLTSPRDVTVSIKQVLEGKPVLPPEVVYDNVLGASIQPGDEVIVLHSNTAAMVANVAVLPMSFMPELLALRENRGPKDALEAAQFLTAVSTQLHWTGAAYYKAFPFAVQDQLAAWMRSASLDPDRSSYGEKNQYLFGLAALMRGPRPGAQEEAIRIMDEFWQLPETASPYAKQWTLTKLALVFEIMSSSPLPEMEAHVQGMIESATPTQLSGLAQSLILSGLKTAEQIAALRRSDDDLAKIKEAALLVAWRHHFVWSREPVKTLLDSIRKLEGTQNEAALGTLEAELTAGNAPLTPGTARVAPSLDTTPWGAGWAIESVLFSDRWWDELAPYQPQLFAGWWMALAVLGAGLIAFFVWRRFNAIATR